MKILFFLAFISVTQAFAMSCKSIDEQKSMHISWRGPAVFMYGPGNQYIEGIKTKVEFNSKFTLMKVNHGGKLLFTGMRYKVKETGDLLHDTEWVGILETDDGQVSFNCIGDQMM